MVAAAAGDDLFVCDATYLTGTTEELGGQGHLTPALAARMADQAGAAAPALAHLSRPTDGFPDGGEARAF